MNIIVTNNTIDYTGFMKLKTLKEVTQVIGTVDTLIYHKSNEKIEDKARYLATLKDSVGRLVYIRNKVDCEREVNLIVVGSGGKYFDDEFFLESGEELSNLIKNMSEVTQLAELGGVQVLTDFFDRYLGNVGGAPLNKAYMSLVKNTVTELVEEYRRKDVELIQMSETASDLFANTLSVVTNLESTAIGMQATIDKLEKMKSEGMLFQQVQSTPPAQVGVFWFPRVNYMKERVIIRIKEVGNCAFLTSFILGFKAYLEKIKFVRTKAIFIEPIGENIEAHYNKYTWITQKNAKTTEPYYKGVVFTNNPNTEVLSRLLDDVNCDVFIVVDRTNHINTHLLNSKGPMRFASSGKTGITSARVKVPQAFTNSDVAGQMFQLKYDGTYPTEQDQRERFYLREYKNQYELLYGMRNT